MSDNPSLELCRHLKKEPKIEELPPLAYYHEKMNSDDDDVAGPPPPNGALQIQDLVPLGDLTKLQDLVNFYSELYQNFDRDDNSFQARWMNEL